MKVTAITETYTPEVSIVVPFYNEEDNIEQLVKDVHKSLVALDIPSEIILVDDGSNDGTWGKINEQCSQYKNLRGLKLSRNFGHQHALTAGLTVASGKAIISMDGDLQHPPELIPEMVNAWKKGNKIVYTQRIDKHVFGPFKRKSSELFYTLFSVLTNVTMQPGSSDFRLIDREVLKIILLFNDADIFLRGSIQWTGYSNTTLPFKAEKRFSGKSKYDLKKMMQFATGAIVSFSTLPLKIGIWIGLITSIFAFLQLTYAVFAFLSNNTVPGWASIVGVMSLLFGIMFLCIGLIGTYVARIYTILQHRPRFIIEDNCQSQTNPLNSNQ